MTDQFEVPEERQLMAVNIHQPFRGFHFEIDGKKVTESEAAIHFGEGNTLDFIFGTLTHANASGWRTLVIAESHKRQHSLALSPFPVTFAMARLMSKRIGWYFLGINWVYRPFKAMASMLMEAVVDLFRPEEDPHA